MSINAPQMLLGARHGTLNRLLADAIRDAIVDGRYKAGERLVEGRLAEDFGVSRIPVREALRLLEAESMVTIAPRKGATVTSVSAQTAREMVEVRATLESLNARLAARHRNPQVIAALQVVLTEGNRAAATGTRADLVRLNGRYHDLLAEAGMNRILGDMMRTLRERTAMQFDAPLAAAERTWTEHAAILQAVINGDEARAARLAERHVSGAARDDKSAPSSTNVSKFTTR